MLYGFTQQDLIAASTTGIVVALNTALDSTLGRDVDSVHDVYLHPNLTGPAPLERAVLQAIVSLP
jgi:hypothetical protein